MLKKPLGLLLAVIGVAGVALYSVPELRKGIPFVSTLNEYILIGFSIVVLLAGLFLATRSGGGGKQPKEVPIFHGKNVVGYRRH